MELMSINCRPRETSYYKDFYKLKKETFIGVYGEDKYRQCVEGAMKVKHFVDANKSPSVLAVSKSMGTGFYYAKDFIELTLQVLSKRQV